jgi:hypothetical protein
MVKTTTSQHLYVQRSLILQSTENSEKTTVRRKHKTKLSSSGGKEPLELPHPTGVFVAELGFEGT